MQRIVAGLLLAALLVWPWAVGAGQFIARQVRCLNVAGGASLLPASQVPRRSVRIINLGGTEAVFIGPQDGSLSATTGWPLHGTAFMNQTHALVLVNTRAGLNCLAASADTSIVGVLEETD